MYPEDLKYAKSHEWVRGGDGKVVVGISHYAQAELQEVVLVDLPAVGTKVEAGKQMAVIESVKAAFDIYAPVSGEVLKVNEKLEEEPETVNSDPYGEGWMLEIKLENPGDLDNLMDAKTYQSTLCEKKEE